MTQTGSTFYLVNSGSPSIGVTITNTGTGNKAAKIVSGGETLNNLNGSISTVSGFTGGGSSVNLGDAFGGPAASQTFTFTPTGITTKGQVVTGSAVATFSNGTGGVNSAGSLTATLTGTGVASVNAVTTPGTVLARVGTSANTTVSVTNVGDGNKSGLGTISNLNGTYTSTLGTGFSGGGSGSVSLADNNSTTLGFTFSPVSRGTSSATATYSFTNGHTTGSNLSQTVTASVAAQGVGPEFKSVYNLVTNTPTPVAGPATAGSGPTINFGSVGVNTLYTVYLDISNTTTDANGGDSTLTDLTLNAFSFAGIDASKFSVGLPGGTVVSKGSTVLLPISVLSSSLGVLASTLTIFTDQGVALGGMGDTFTYSLTALIVPEPTTMAVLGSGLLGLAALRNRKRRQKEAEQA